MIFSAKYFFSKTNTIFSERQILFRDYLFTNFAYRNEIKNKYKISKNSKLFNIVPECRFQETKVSVNVSQSLATKYNIKKFQIKQILK